MFLRAQNITATDGSTVTLRCHLLIDDTKVIQVNWNFCNDEHIAFHVNDHDTEAIVLQAYADRVSRAKDYGITISEVNRNDTGLYCCIYNTFPHGRFTGKIYLHVLSKETWTPELHLWAGCGLGILLVFAVIGAGSLYYKKKKSCAGSSNINPKTSGAKPVGSNIPSAALILSTSEEEEADGEYFNIILYNNMSDGKDVPVCISMSGGC
ncbi:T-cell immunoreceptor with Ig and ITIM domains [Rhinoderma darwinii]|uniref:T-cell immunoreceptor with Ig and ITIM domains n=1 Tax=Rhinoderma darwinii TaxID=43563 RepID=UPI003F67D84E